MTDEALNQARLESSVRVHVENYKKKWPSPYAIASGVLLLLSFLKYVYSPLQWLALGAVAAGIFPILMKCVGSIRNLKIDINILVIVAGMLGVRLIMCLCVICKILFPSCIFRSVGASFLYW